MVGEWIHYAWNRKRQALQTPVLVVPARTINSLSSIDVPRSILRRQTNHNPSESPGGEELDREESDAADYAENKDDSALLDRDECCDSDSGAVFVVNASVVSGPRVFNRAGDTGNTSKICIGVVGVATPGMDAGVRDLNLTIRLPTPSRRLDMGGTRFVVSLPRISGDRCGSRTRSAGGHTRGGP